MTQKSTDWSTGQPRKMDGWFSWRHRTRDAHDAARERYLTRRGPAARQGRAQERLSHSTPEGNLLRNIFGAQA